MQIPPYIKVVTFSDYVVLHNLKSGGWVKITREYYEQLASYLSTNELSEFKSQLDDFDEFVEYLIRNEYLYNEETVCCGDEPGPGIRHGDIKLVYLHLCDACNLRCRTCYFSPSDSPTYLSTEVAKRTVRLLAMGGNEGGRSKRRGTAVASRCGAGSEISKRGGDECRDYHERDFA